MPEDIDSRLFPNGEPSRKADQARTFELYQIMVKTSEDLVSRRQGVNTFFVSINGALLTALGIAISSRIENVPKLAVAALLCITGATLAQAWRSRIKSFGQLNTGKFKVITRLERSLPAAIFDAEWQALGEGRDPKIYKTFTSREMWPPWIFFGVYCLVGLAAVVAAILYFAGVDVSAFL